MKKDAKTFHEVAERCTKFCPCQKCGCGNETDYSAQAKTSGSASDCGSNKTDNRADNKTTGSTNRATNSTSKASNSTNKATNSTSKTSNSTNRATNATSENVSCKNCSHYDPNKVCSLDLYTEIVENHHL